MTKQQQLEAIRNRRTRYEVVAVKDGQRIQVGFTARYSRIGLLRLMQQNGQHWVDALGLSHDDKMTKATNRGFMLGAWAVSFSSASLWRSGRTLMSKRQQGHRFSA